MRSFQPQRLQKPDKQNIFKMASSAFFLGIIVSRGEKIFRYRMRLSLKNIDRDTFHWNRFSDFRLQLEVFFFRVSLLPPSFEPLERSRRGLVPTTKRLSRLFRVVSMSRTEDPLLSKKKKIGEKLKTELTFFFTFLVVAPFFFTRKLNCTIFLEAISCSKFEFITFSEQTILF